ncbi:MAG: hypothetical protein K0R36_1935 [Chryseobacterium sp.]|jgi:hypothetical protein|nr:hypothetical protein [Chryseobacterium sp.]
MKKENETDDEKDNEEGSFAKSFLKMKNIEESKTL